jgi:riboflavin kinase/FMN adenylyltransferase
MEVLHSLDEAPQTAWDRLVLSIGNFDGVHRGHLKVLQALRQAAAAHSSAPAVLTFRNHPREVLQPQGKVCKLCSLDQRLHLLESAGVKYCFLLDFTKDFSRQSAEQFVKQLTQALPLEGLLLGHDAVLGYDRGGQPHLLHSLAQAHGFSLDYVQAEAVNEHVVSSSKIRECLARGQLGLVAELLGRPYSVQGTVQPGSGLGKELGFPTINLPVDDLCLPPFGVYDASVQVGRDTCIHAIANLGYAPTLQERKQAVLEAFLFDWSQSLYGREVSIELKRFVRPEQQFASRTELTQQIQCDIDSVRVSQ